MSKGIIDTIIGGVEIAAGIIVVGIPGGQYLGAMLIAAGAGMLLVGIGTLMQGSGGGGVITASRNPIDAAGFRWLRRDETKARSTETKKPPLWRRALAALPVNIILLLTLFAASAWAQIGVFPPAASTPAQYKTLTCEAGLGDGLNAMAAGTYLQSTCWNKTGVTITITSIQCFTDNAGTSTLNATDGSASALLTGAVTCSSTIASGTQGSTTTIASGGFIKFTFVADGTSKQTTWVVAGTY